MQSQAYIMTHSTSRVCDQPIGNQIQEGSQHFKLEEHADINGGI